MSLAINQLILPYSLFLSSFYFGPVPFVDMQRPHCKEQSDGCAVYPHPSTMLGSPLWFVPNLAYPSCFPNIHSLSRSTLHSPFGPTRVSPPMATLPPTLDHLAREVPTRDPSSQRFGYALVGSFSTHVNHSVTHSQSSRYGREQHRPLASHPGNVLPCASRSCYPISRERHPQ